jgi:hypothetical protein
MSFSLVPFTSLRKLLFGLGFAVKAVPPSPQVPVPGTAFYHAASGCFFVLRPYRPQDRVSTMDLMGIRSQLDRRGLMSEEAFDAALGKASA